MASPEGCGGLSEALRYLLQADDKRFDHARQQGMPEPHQHRSWLIQRQDYFYVCPGHLKDRGFAMPIIDEAEAAAKKKKEAMDREIELIKQEYEEKMKKKQKNKDKDKKAKDADKGKEKAKDDESKDDDDDEKAKKEKDDKVSSVYQSRQRPLLTIMQDQSHYQQRTSVSR